MKAIILAAVTLFGGIAFAERTEAAWWGDTQELHGTCESSIDTDRSHCYGYIYGVISNGHASMTQRYCMPSSTQGSTLRKVVVKYGNDNPRELATVRNPAVFVAEALEDAFPCN